MVDRSGHIELDRAVESIQVGRRHRHDLGDLTELVESIRDMGMLQPITVTPDGRLICGARRLAAAKQLGLRRIHVWVRSGISTELERLLAESHDNTVRKPFSPSEAAGLYQELKTLMADDAARRQEATQFGGDNGADHGPAESAGPNDGDSRAQAARLVTGRKSYTRLEQIVELQRLANHSTASPRRHGMQPHAALEQIEVDGKVNGHYQHVTSLPTAPAEPAPHSEGSHSRPSSPRPTERSGEQPGRRHRLRAFLLVLHELSGWTDRCDPVEIGPALTAEQWGEFETALTETVAFADTARLARRS